MYRKISGHYKISHVLQTPALSFQFPDRSILNNGTTRPILLVCGIEFGITTSHIPNTSLFRLPKDIEK